MTDESQATAADGVEEEAVPPVAATRRIRWAYNPDLDLIGTEEDVPVVEARNFVWEGRAVYVDQPEAVGGPFDNGGYLPSAVSTLRNDTGGPVAITPGMVLPDGIVLVGDDGVARPLPEAAYQAQPEADLQPEPESEPRRRRAPKADDTAE